jgi:exonuclease SbcD
MKILHTADWHIGKRLEHYSRVEEQHWVLNEICDIANQEDVDAIIIAGDLFDTYNPSSEAIELFYKTLKKLSKQGTRPVIAISGNHDSPDRIETADPLARECGIIFIGYPDTALIPFTLESGLKVLESEPGFIELKLPNYSYPLRIITTPYANEHRLKQAFLAENKEEELRDILEQKWRLLAQKYCDKNGVNLLATHLFVVSRESVVPEEPDDEKPILHVGGAQAIYTDNFPEAIQYVALGHLHRKQLIKSVKQAVVYPGSPLSYSFAEANQQKFVAIAHIEPGQTASVNFIELKKGKKLLRLRAAGINDALIQLNENKDHLVELTIETDTYLNAKDRKRLNQEHTGIITLIPQVKNDLSASKTNRHTIDLDKTTKELFIDYFKHINKLEPNDSLLNLFNEVIAEKESEA